MSPDQKPEWFQLVEADNAASTRKISKGLPVMAILAFAAIIGIGTVVAQPQDAAPANATETVAATPTVTNSAVAPRASSTPGIASPLSKKPTGGEHEGEDD